MKMRPSRRGGQGAVFFGQDERRAPIPDKQDLQQHHMTAALAHALGELPEADRPELLRWLVERGLVGAARASGICTAAIEADRLAKPLRRGAP